MGTSNDNYEELMRTDLRKVCGLKIFMGSSTGNMLVDHSEVLNRIFANFSGLIATHCEDEQTIKDNTAAYLEKYGEDMPIKYHPEIRDAEACYLSSSKAKALAVKHGTRLHILHISTAREIELFDNKLALKDKKITSEACTHHLWFSDADYETKGTHIKWNPAVKSADDRAAVRAALNDDRIDVLATDHAPHTLAEKSNNYFNAPSGGPLVQHTLSALFELSEQGIFTKEKIIEKACHNPAILFDIEERGYIREGYKADLVLVAKDRYTVNRDNLLYKCGWSPFEGQEFQYKVQKTFVNGNLVFENGKVNDAVKGERLVFRKRD
ncbi:MAG: amidohydrolase family protein, partial [Chitinophagales bacterium]